MVEITVAVLQGNLECSVVVTFSTADSTAKGVCVCVCVHVCGHVNMHANQWAIVGVFPYPATYLLGMVSINRMLQME